MDVADCEGSWKKKQRHYDRVTFPPEDTRPAEKKRDLDLKQREFSSILKRFFTSKCATLCFVVLFGLWSVFANISSLTTLRGKSGRTFMFQKKERNMEKLCFSSFVELGMTEDPWCRHVSVVWTLPQCLCTCRGYTISLFSGFHSFVGILN